MSADNFDITLTPGLATLIAGDRPVRWLARDGMKEAGGGAWGEGHEGGWDPASGAEVPDVLFCKGTPQSLERGGQHLFESYWNLLHPGEGEAGAEAEGIGSHRRCLRGPVRPGTLQTWDQAWDGDIFWNMANGPAWQRGIYPFIISWNTEPNFASPLPSRGLTLSDIRGSREACVGIQGGPPLPEETVVYVAEAAFMFLGARQVPMEALLKPEVVVPLAEKPHFAAFLYRHCSRDVGTPALIVSWELSDSANFVCTPSSH
jgi:hypothetical protein